MATSISLTLGDTRADITGTIVDIRGLSDVGVRAEWPLAGATAGTVGLKVGLSRDHMEDLGSLSGPNFPGYSGGQPNGTAGSIATRIRGAFNFAQLYFTRSSGGAAGAMFGEIKGIND